MPIAAEQFTPKFTSLKQPAFFYLLVSEGQECWHDLAECHRLRVSRKRQSRDQGISWHLCPLTTSQTEGLVLSCAVKLWAGFRSSLAVGQRSSSLPLELTTRQLSLSERGVRRRARKKAWCLCSLLRRWQPTTGDTSTQQEWILRSSHTHREIPGGGGSLDRVRSQEAGDRWTIVRSQEAGDRWTCHHFEYLTPHTSIHRTTEQVLFAGLASSTYIIISSFIHAAVSITRLFWPRDIPLLEIHNLFIR